MRKIIIYVTLTVLSFLIWYLGCAFVTLEFDFRDWDKMDRFLILMEGAITAVGACAIVSIKTE